MIRWHSQPSFHPTLSDSTSTRCGLNPHSRIGRVSERGVERDSAGAAIRWKIDAFQVAQMIVIDTSLPVDALTGLKSSGLAVRGALDEDEKILSPALVLYEWLRGPRIGEELALQESLFPSKSAVPFD